MASDPDRQIYRNPVEARQGSTRPRVIYVLIASIILIVIVFALTGTFLKH